MPFELFLIAWLGVNLVFASLAAYLASRWGRDSFGWLFVGAVLGPIAVILLLVEHRWPPRATPSSLASAGPRTRSASSPAVLVAVDGSSFSDQAVKYVLEHFGTTLEEVTAVGVLPRERAEGAAMEESSPRRDLLEEETERYLGSACSTLRNAGVACRSVVRFGEPASEILELAREMNPDVIVVGRRGRGKTTRLLLGSVSERITKEAPCPVTVVG